MSEKDEKKSGEDLDPKDINADCGNADVQDEIPVDEAPESDLEEEDPEELLLSELEALKDSHLRLRAEYDNFRKRTLKEKSDLLKYAAEKVVIDFLEILDDFDRALANIDTTDEASKTNLEGVTLIHDKMLAKLRGQGVKEIDVLGQPFEADKHEAIAMVPVEESEKKGAVIDCVQKGYTLNDKVIRHPKVVVGQ